jgi:hypothetical protein
LCHTVLCACFCITSCYILIKMSHNIKHSGRERKERVIHTRVPQVLEAELKRLAESLRVPVSNVVRAVLENALEAAESATRTAHDEVEDLSERLSWMRKVHLYSGDDSRENLSEEDAEDTEDKTQGRPERDGKQRALDKIMRSVIGFQPLTLAKPTRCACCDREIEPHQQAYVTVRDRKGPKLIIGVECLPKNNRVSNDFTNKEERL